MAAGSIGDVRNALAERTLADCETAAEAALSAATPEEARARAALSGSPSQGGVANT
jgi:phosphoenolpyruvate-protein kinase (PTS system EI component)